MESQNLQKPLLGRIALISGGGTGIGGGIALALARAGARVAVCGRRREPLDKAVGELKALGADAAAVIGDVSKPEDCRRIVAETVAQFGALHTLVNNAGIARYAALADTSDDDLASMIDTNVKGTMLLTKYALPELEKHSAASKKDGGTKVDVSVLIVASSVADKPMKDFSVYSAAKAALVHFTRCMAIELSDKRIRVNCINPGVVETPIFATMMPSAAVPHAMGMYAAKTPLGRVGQPDDIANAALFLVSPQSNWITGAVLTVDGGISLS